MPPNIPLAALAPAQASGLNNDNANKENNNDDNNNDNDDENDDNVTIMFLI